MSKLFENTRARIIGLAGAALIALAVGAQADLFPGGGIADQASNDVCVGMASLGASGPCNNYQYVTATIQAQATANAAAHATAVARSGTPTPVSFNVSLQDAGGNSLLIRNTDNLAAIGWGNKAVKASIGPTRALAAFTEPGFRGQCTSTKRARAGAAP